MYSGGLALACAAVCAAVPPVMAQQAESVSLPQAPAPAAEAASVAPVEQDEPVARFVLVEAVRVQRHGQDQVRRA